MFHWLVYRGFAVLGCRFNDLVAPSLHLTGPDCQCRQQGGWGGNSWEESRAKPRAAGLLSRSIGKKRPRLPWGKASSLFSFSSARNHCCSTVTCTRAGLFLFLRP